MQNFSVHPATRVVAWLALLISVQCLRGASLALTCLLLPLFGWRALRRGGRLVWRARWLLLSLVVVFAWGTAGEPLPDFWWAPTLEGLQEALQHLGRMLLVLFFVGGFLEFTPMADLLAAAHVLLHPFRCLGLEPERGVVRLMLVLRYVETLPRPRDWKSLLEAPEAGAIEVVEIDQQAMRWTDRVILFTLVGLVAWLLYA